MSLGLEKADAFREDFALRTVYYGKRVSPGDSHIYIHFH